MAAMALGSLGSSLLGPLGGFIGSAIGSAVDNWLFAAIGPTQKGPRLDDLNVTRADPGVAIPIVFGADRLAGIIVASTPLIETKHKESVGKGGGPKIITYTYHVDIDYMLCEGPIIGIGRIWADGNLIRGTREDLEASTSENPENIGGIPYPQYYKNNMYDPKSLPRSLDPSLVDTMTGESFITSADRKTMKLINTPSAEDFGTNDKVIYWRDFSTGFFVPYAQDHAYGVETRSFDDIVTRGAASEGFGITGSGPGGGNDEAGTDTITLIDLYDSLGVDAKNPDGSWSVIPSYKFTSFVTQPFWPPDSDFNVSDRLVQVKYNYFADGQLDDVDGSITGQQLGSGLTNHFLTSSPADVIGGFPAVPPNTRFIKVTTGYSMLFPIFAESQPAVEGSIILDFIKKKKKKAPEPRDWPDYYNLYDALNDFSKRAVLKLEGLENITVYHGRMDQIVDPIMGVSLDKEYIAYAGRAHVVFDHLQLDVFGNRIPNLTFEVVQYDDARISNVLEDLMTRAEIDPKYYDLTALPDKGVKSHILGYTIGDKTSFRAAMETIMEAFRVDAAEIGNEIVFRPRSRETSEWTIPYGDLAAMDAGSDVREKIEYHYRDKLEMPKSISVNFKDVERFYQQNSARYSRQQVISVQDSQMELAAVMPPAMAKEYARDKLRDLWLERVSIKFKLPHRYVYVYPTDIVTITGGDRDIRCKITTVTRGSNGILEVEAVLRELQVYNADAGEVTNTDMDGTTWNHSPTIPGSVFQTQVIYMDIPPLRESDIGPSFYVAMGGNRGWGGGSLYRSADDGMSYDLLVSSTDRAILGNAASALPFSPAEYVDTTNYVDIQLIDAGDALSSITSDQLWNGFNAFYLGGEVIQFMTAAQLPNGNFRLTNLLRGRRGTDLPELMSGHEIGDQFVLLRTGPVLNVADNLSYVGPVLKYKGVSNGSTEAATDFDLFVNTGNRFKPLAPIHVGGTRNEDGDLTLVWTRRDRLYQTMVNGSDIKNSEETMTFRIRLLSDVDGHFLYERFVRDATETVFTAGTQTGVGITLGDTLRVEINQVSALVGFGHTAEARV